MKWIDVVAERTGWTAEELEAFMAGEWFSGMPVSPERLEEMRDELRRMRQAALAVTGRHDEGSGK